MYIFWWICRIYRFYLKWSIEFNLLSVHNCKLLSSAVSNVLKKMIYHWSILFSRIAVRLYLYSKSCWQLFISFYVFIKQIKYESMKLWNFCLLLNDTEMVIQVWQRPWSKFMWINIFLFFTFILDFLLFYNKFETCFNSIYSFYFPL